MDLEINRAVSVFVQIAANSKKRLVHGASLRAEMRKAMEEGRKPTGYRAEWLRESACILVHVLGDIAADFDAEHLDDRASITDLMDIVATAAGLLQHEAGKGEDDDD